MTDEPTTTETTPQTDPPPDATDATPPGADTPEWVKQNPDAAYGEIQKLRKEAADNRTRSKDIEARLTAFEKEQANAEKERRAAEEKRLAENQEFQALAEQRKEELTAAQQAITDLETKAARVEQLETFLRQSAETRTQALPERYQSMVPQFDDPLQTLAWLDANAQHFAAPPAPQTDAGAVGDVTPKDLKLSDAERKAADAMKISHEKYAARKQQMHDRQQQRE